jgi:polyphosphate:AMP phosphotransferase
VFEAAELGSAVSEEDYEARLPSLRVDLLNAQYDLRTADFPVVILLTGDDRAGVNETLNVLHEWMDARYLATRVFSLPRPEESDRPAFARYWDALPRKGQCAVFVGDWSTTLLAEYATGRIDEAAFARGIDHVERLEEMLADDGALLVKLWLHVPEKERRHRAKKWKKNGGGSRNAIDREVARHAGELLSAADRLIRATSTAAAPWQTVEGTDARYRNLTVAETILAALRGRLEKSGGRDAALAMTAAAAVPDVDPRTSVLSGVDLSATLPDDAYRERLDAAQVRLGELVYRARKRDVATVLVFEGWDAAGKGGAIRRITRALDARDYTTHAISAPTEEEKAHHYLWRFWRRLPRDGMVAIFDRSWYGRVLVERVEGYAKDFEWRRAYAEIDDFEDQLLEHGNVVAKFWLHVSPEEQQRRFEARAKTDFKKYKLTDEDWRNRARRGAYEAAVDEMVARTSTEAAPWHLVAANDKRHARVAVLEIVADALKRRLKRS